MGDLIHPWNTSYFVTYLLDRVLCAHVALYAYMIATNNFFLNKNGVMKDRQ